ncbi:MAG: endopeptidase La [Rickettsiales bacterium]|nr:endopeptidase La [Rickettsiales bacterium]
MKNKINKSYPLVPLRDVVVFPHMITPLFVGRSKSINAIENMNAKNREVVMVAQKDSSIESPKRKDLYKVGVITKILQTLKLPDGTLKILVEAKEKVKITKIIDSQNEYFEAAVDKVKDKKEVGVEIEALKQAVLNEFREYSKYNSKISSEIIKAIEDIKDPGNLVDIVVSNMSLEISKKQNFLEIGSLHDKLKKLLVAIEYEIGLLKAKQKIRDDVKKEVDQAQQEFFLKEQLKAIHKQLGDSKHGSSEVAELEQKIKKTALSKEAKEKATKELEKLKLMNPISADAAIIRNYLDNILSLPWGKKTKLKLNITESEKVLNTGHYGLDKVKDRILEFLSVQKRTKSIKGPILCFVGPPGVGKTSLAKSIAEATGRNFVKFSLGGVRDEAEIRGHRRTYLGSMPGKILYLLKKAKSSNPVMLLDEIDKIASDYRGDLASALLEVLDPEQNSQFVDHYLETEFDISKVMFIATANSTDIHPALLDRMEIIRIAGYTEDEKQSITRSHLLKKQYKEHALTEKDLHISDNAIMDIIRYYTREAGIRNLERELAKIARKVVREMNQEAKKSIKVNSSNLHKYLGVKKYQYGESEKTDLVGVTTGLAYTEVGGDLLSIEALLVPGDGKIKMTGKLGEVMQESAQAAFSFFCSRLEKYSIDYDDYKSKDIHLHVPEGAVPKDGPSAGVAIFTSIVSALTNIPVKKTVAMTGEITLSGRVLPIGGLKEKLLAAHRGGIKTVLIPFENEKDLVEIPKNITQNLKIIPVKTADEVINCALINTFFKKNFVKDAEIKQIKDVNYPKCTITH